MGIKKGAAVLAVLLLAVMTLCAFVQDVDNKDKVAIFSSIDIPGGMTVNGDAVSIFGGVTVNGDISGDVVAIFGNVEVSGTVSGDAVAVFGRISVKDSGSISGDAVGIVGGVDKAPNGVIRGEIADVNIPFNIKRHEGIIPRISYGDMVGLFLIYAFSCLAVLVVPDRIMFMSEESRQQIGRRFGIGFLISILFVPASVVLSVLLAITLIGIVFIPFIFIAFFLAAFVGMVALEIAIGYRITGMLEGRYSTYIYLMVGVVLVYALRMIPVAGFLAYLAMGVYSIGVAADTRLGAPKVRRQTSNV
ncbi:MAG TPA: hypothetical protein VN580_13550 [Clostridia bacterium]|nr:hypothetical protein [Clostridia bacterium]